MKKKIYTLILTLILLMSVFVFAKPIGINKQSYNIKLVQKNPSDWSTVKGGSYGNLLLWYGNQAQIIGLKLKPDTKYTLIYYGYDGHNDVWPYATCITTAMTNSKGNLNAKATFDYSGFVNDNFNQKFWLVLSSNVECDNHKMIAWNPISYLFEMKTI